MALKFTSDIPGTDLCFFELQKAETGLCFQNKEQARSSIHALGAI